MAKACDQGIAALIKDLRDRGLLDETLVVCLGEFGRAPLVALEPRFAGATAGRKHWAAAYSVVFAGAGVSRGAVVGKSDRHAAYPVSAKFAPWDVTATVFNALGIDPSVVADLRARGHEVRVLSGYERAGFGGGQLIVRDPETGVLWGGSEPRKDGAAVGW